MGQIEDLRLFLKTVDSGGIARAADEMGIAKSAVSRRLARLEERYGVRLIDRQPRVWEVTSAGQELYQRATSMVADADDLDADFLHLGHAPKGPLSITVAREFGLTFLKSTLFQFSQNHPQIDLLIDQILLATEKMLARKIDSSIDQEIESIVLRVGTCFWIETTDFVIGRNDLAMETIALAIERIDAAYRIFETASVKSES